MKLDDKLKNLRRERAARTRSQKIKETWNKIEEADGLTVKEKLEKLISLQDKQRRPKKDPAPPAFEPLYREPVQVIENSYPLGVRYGHIPIALGLEITGSVLSFLGRDELFGNLDLSSAVFIDLETTGLSGGTGTLPFLTGLGYFRDDRFWVIQYFLGEMAEEGRLIRDLGRFFEEMNFRSVVSYNGKAYDLPLLETRFILNKIPFPLGDLPHLDFLFSARNLWKHKYDNCRLFHLAREIVQADRGEDIPSAEIPLRYFQYIRTGDISLVDPILYHNQEDILSLLGIIVAGAVLVDRHHQSPEGEEADAMDLYGVARLYERAGDTSASAALLERALEGRLTMETSLSAKKKLASHFKKSKDWSRAITLWQQATGDDEPHSFRELAMYYEHKEKNYEEAIRIAEEGLALSMERSLSLQKDFEKRIDRLRRKVRKLQEKTSQ